MSTTISQDEIERDLAEYLRRVQAGETFVITSANKPIAEVKPVEPAASALRPFGLAAGELVIADDFDAPLPPNILDEFEGK